MSYFVTQELVDQAIALVRPAIEGILESDLVGGRKNIHIVVIEPDGATFEESIASDPRESWSNPYDEIARGKAKLCQRTGMPSGHVMERTPCLLQDSDPRYAGGVVEDGLVVAISGLQAYFDEMLAWMIFNAITGLCADAVAKIRDVENAPHFIGEGTV